MTLTCVAVESPKNIPFVLSLSFSRLASRNTTCLPSNSSSSNDINLKGRDDDGNTVAVTPVVTAFDSKSYTDELEYQEGGKNSGEGDIVTDIDFDAPNIPTQQTSGGEGGGSDDLKTLKQRKSSNPSINWPKTIEGLVVGRRVDALDHRNQWFSGTIVDKWMVTADEMLELISESPSRNGSIDGTKARRKSKSDASVPPNKRTLSRDMSTSNNSITDRIKGP